MAKMTLKKMHDKFLTHRTNPRWSWAGCNQHVVLVHLCHVNLSPDRLSGKVYDPTWHEPSHPAHREMRDMLQSVMAGKRSMQVVLLKGIFKPGKTSLTTEEVHPVPFSCTLELNADGCYWVRRYGKVGFPLFAGEHAQRVS